MVMCRLLVFLLCSSCTFFDFEQEVKDSSDAFFNYPSVALNKSERFILEKKINFYLDILKLNIEDVLVQRMNVFSDCNVVVDWDIDREKRFRVSNKQIHFSSAYLEKVDFYTLVFDFTCALLETKSGEFLETIFIESTKKFSGRKSLSKNSFVENFSLNLFSKPVSFVRIFFSKEWTIREKTQIVSLFLLYNRCFEATNLHPNLSSRVKRFLKKNEWKQFFANQKNEDEYSLSLIIFDSDLRFALEDIKKDFIIVRR